MVFLVFFFLLLSFVTWIYTLFLKEYVSGLDGTWFIGTWLIANALDGHSTICCLSTKRGTEANPIIALFINLFGPVRGVIAAKVILGIIFTYLFFKDRDALACLGILLFLATINNYRIYYRLRNAKECTFLPPGVGGWTD